MGIDDLQFKGEGLTSPDRLITVMEWKPRFHSFAAKTYISFIQEVSDVELYFSSLNSEELMKCSKDLEDWSIEDSDFGVDPSPLKPDCTNPKGSSKYARGPICQQEVDDLRYLFNFYANQDAELVHYY